MEVYSLHQQTLLDWCRFSNSHGFVDILVGLEHLRKLANTGRDRLDLFINLSLFFFNFGKGIRLRQFTRLQTFICNVQRCPSTTHCCWWNCLTNLHFGKRCHASWIPWWYHDCFRLRCSLVTRRCRSFRNALVSYDFILEMCGLMGARHREAFVLGPK